MYRAAMQFRCTPQRRGATAVEFAVVVPILLLFLIAFFELGHALMLDSIIENAAYEGARRGIIPGATPVSMIQAAERIANTSSLNNMVVMIEPSTITHETDFVTVRVSTRLSRSGLLVGQYLLGQEIERTVTMAREPNLRSQFRPDVINRNLPSTPKPRGRARRRR